MPNWEFSYALELFRLHLIDESTKDLTKAIQLFPSVPFLLIQCNTSSNLYFSLVREWKYRPTPPECFVIIDIVVTCK